MRRPLATIATLLLSVYTAEAEEIIVPVDYPNIQAAVDNASPNDTILVQPQGVYNGEIVIDGAQSLTVMGLGIGDLRPVLANTGGVVFRILGSQHVVIGNFRIFGVGVVRVGSGQVGIAIESNEIRDSASAIRMRGGTGHRIVGNDIRSVERTAVRVRDVSSIDVIDNTLNKCGGHGVRIRESSDVVVEGNAVYESAQDGIRIFECAGVTIGSEGAGNIASRNRESGIRVRASTNAAIGSNVTNANHRYGVRVIDTDTIDVVTDLTAAANVGECNVEADFRVGAQRSSGTCNATTTTTSTSTTTTVGLP